MQVLSGSNNAGPSIPYQRAMKGEELDFVARASAGLKSKI
jgi:hypothetical protein